MAVNVRDADCVDCKAQRFEVEGMGFDMFVARNLVPLLLAIFIFFPESGTVLLYFF